MSSKVVIESDDWIRYLRDKLYHERSLLQEMLREDWPEFSPPGAITPSEWLRNQEEQKSHPNYLYLSGQVAAISHMEFLFDQLVAETILPHNVINNFYALQMKNPWFEDKYRELWRKDTHERN